MHVNDTVCTQDDTTFGYQRTQRHLLSDMLSRAGVQLDLPPRPMHEPPHCFGAGIGLPHACCVRAHPHMDWLL